MPWGTSRTSARFGKHTTFELAPAAGSITRRNAPQTLPKTQGGVPKRDGVTGLDTLETQRLVIRPFTMDDLAIAHPLLDGDIQWAGPSISLEKRREQLQFQVALTNWDQAGRIYGHRAILGSCTSQRSVAQATALKSSAVTNSAA
jgi:hypothetical protein